MTDAVRLRFARFAEEEAPGRSALYEAWARGVADDGEIAGVLARIPETRRQPPLVFAVTRMLGAELGDYAEWRAFVLAHADEIVEECTRRRLQTNEPLRLAPLLAVLTEIEGPLALLEIGASAGLCLFPDRYSYRYLGEDGRERLRLDPSDGVSPVVLESVVRGGMPPVRMPEVVWRAGIDLDPLDARSAQDRRWLQGLVWPGEEEREQRVSAALDIAAADPPRLVAGDALDAVAALAAEAPAGATLVITTPGVLVHIPRAAREELVRRIRALPARWVTIDPPALLDVWEPPIDDPSWAGFAVALDAGIRASADPLGRSWEWRAGDARTAT
ncbi:DUF2332 domain-containing protein [Streptomyces sp. AC495_CC817]|uniref:DUF2332 domain-containing protein n=1 Tax=Streptomyces sp. AC495_CC817 TaxID=2823900 RepID=UPI001C25F608|nr:DUF2332 domain-containing protein [Streptomyces sp. AC495_CC817]